MLFTLFQIAVVTIAVVAVINTIIGLYFWHCILRGSKE